MNSQDEVSLDLASGELVRPRASGHRHTEKSASLTRRLQGPERLGEAGRALAGASRGSVAL